VDGVTGTGPVRRTEGGVTVALRVQPRARRAAIEGIVTDADGGAALKVAVTAPPEDGKANAAVVALLARAWRVPKGAVTVIRGAAARHKTVRVEGEPAALEAAILDSAGAKGKNRHG